MRVVGRGARVVTVLVQVVGAEMTTKEVHSRVEVLTKQRHRWTLLGIRLINHALSGYRLLSLYS